MLADIKVPWKTQTISANDNTSSTRGAATNPRAKPNDFNSMPTPKILPLMWLFVFCRMVACRVVKHASKIPVKKANGRMTANPVFDNKV